MRSDLLSCKKEAVALTKSSEPPRYPNGRKKGYMKLMHELWNEKGYGDLGLSEQNLCDRARDYECKQTEVLSSVSQTIDEDRIVAQDETRNTNTNFVYNEIDVNSDLLSDDKYSDLISKSESVYNDISTTCGDFSKRKYTTKFRDNPTVADINYIDNACQHLIEKKQINGMQNALAAFWVMNCIVYSVIAGWIIVNDLKRMEIVTKAKPRTEIRVPNCVADVDREIKDV